MSLQIERLKQTAEALQQEFGIPASTKAEQAALAIEYQKVLQLEQINSTLDALLIEFTNLSYTIRNRS